MKLFLAVAVLAVSLTNRLGFCADPPARPAELKELERLVGTWKVAEFVNKKAEWNPEEVRGSGDVATTRWIMDGWYLEDRKAPANGSDHLGIWHYDQAEKAYHYTMFQTPGGGRMDITVLWDEKAQVFSGKGSMANGLTMRTATRFPDKNTKAWTAVVTDTAGKVYLDLSCKEVRTEAESVKQAPGGAYVDEAATALQGLWLAQSVEVEGRKSTAEFELKQVRFEFNANKLVFKMDGPEVECTFKTDPKQSPKHLTLLVKESDQRKVKDQKTILAIYELKGDELRIGISGSDKRPTEFSTQEKSGLMLFVLKRRQR